MLFGLAKQKTGVCSVEIALVVLRAHGKNALERVDRVSKSFA